MVKTYLFKIVDDSDECLICSNLGKSTNILEDSNGYFGLCKKCNSPNYNLLVCRNCGDRKILNHLSLYIINSHLFRVNKKFGIEQGRNSFIPYRRGGITIIIPRCRICTPWISVDYLVQHRIVISI